jgi:hypothetical protein
MTGRYAFRATDPQLQAAVVISGRSKASADPADAHERTIL